MGFFVDKHGVYFEGDQQDATDQIVTLRPDPYHVWDGNQWVLPLAQAKESQISLLSSDCSTQIYAGFQSSALGAAYTYPANDKDQANLSASVLASLLPGLPANWTTPFPCQDGSGTWAHVQHTAAQIQQVGSDAKAAIVAAIMKNATLAQQVSEAISVAAVQAIVW